MPPINRRQSMVALAGAGVLLPARAAPLLDERRPLFGSPARLLLTRDADPLTVALVWAGLGGIGYTTTQPFTNYLSIQSDPNFSGTTVANVSGSSTSEPLTFGTWASITGNGSSGSGCSVSSTPAGPAARLGPSVTRASAPASSR